MYLCELVVATRTANYATYIRMALLYGRDLGRKWFSIKVGNKDNVKHFLKMDSVSHKLLEGQRNDVRYIEKLCFENSIMFRKSEGNISLTYSVEDDGEEVRS